MAFPTYINKGTFQSTFNATGPTPSLPASIQNGDLLIAVVSTPNDTTLTSVDSDWTLLATIGDGTVATAGAVDVWVWYAIYNGVALGAFGTTNQRLKTQQVYAFRDAKTPTIYAAAQRTAATNWTLPSITTTSADNFIFFAIGNDRDANSTANVSGYTNSNLANITELHDEVVNTGVGGGIATVYAEKATAGSTGTTSCTSAASNTASFITFAIEPIEPIVSGSLSVTESGSDTFVSTGDVIVQGSLSVSETGADSLASNGGIVYGNTASDGLPGDVSGTSFVAITTVLPVRTGAAGDLFFSGQLGFEPQTLTNGGYSVAAIWRYRTVGGSWTDVGTEIAQTNAALVAEGVLDTVGAINVAASITTLSANTNYEVQLYARRLLISPTNTVGFYSNPTDATVTSIATSGVTGTLNAVETGSDTLASTGKVTVQGSLAATETGSDTLVSTGKVIVQGTLSATETGSDTLSSSGDVIVQGALAATETGADALASTGYVIVQGSLAVTESGSDTFVSDADLIVQGSLAVAESGSDTFVSGGNVIIQGAISATETGSDTFAATGDVFVAGTLSATETGSDTFASAGTVLVQGTFATTETGADTFAASGTVEATSVSGTLSATESGSDTITSSGTILVQGSISATEETTDTVMSSGIVLVNGTLTATEENLDTLASNGSILVQGSLAVTESDSDTFVSNGNVVATGNLAVTEDTADTFVAAGVIPCVGNLAVTESESDTIVSTGKLIVAGTLSAIETGSDALVANGTVTASPILGSLSAQESGQDTAFVYGFTLAAQPIVEYNVRLFDSMRSPGNLRGAYKSLRGLEHMMWDRILQQCVYNPNVYVTADDPDTWRIGYGRPVTKSFAVEEAELKEARESVWLRSKLTNLYKRVASANPTAELSDVLLSTLYYYHVENQKR